MGELLGRVTDLKPFYKLATREIMLSALVEYLDENRPGAWLLLSTLGN